MKKSLEGNTYNNLKVINFYDIKNKNSRWNCECLLCGQQTIVSRPNIISGNTKDCGCRRIDKIKKAVTKHGKIHSGSYKSWAKMKQRIKKGSEHSPIYGKITMDERWNVFENFYKDMGDRPHNLTLDRIDNSKGYYKDNCRWVDHKQQSRNRSSNVILKFNNKSMCISEWAEYLGINRSTIKRRINKGYPLNEVLKKTNYEKENGKSKRQKCSCLRSRW